MGKSHCIVLGALGLALSVGVSCGGTDDNDALPLGSGDSGVGGSGAGSSGAGGTAGGSASGGHAGDAGSGATGANGGDGGSSASGGGTGGSGATGGGWPDGGDGDAAPDVDFSYDAPVHDGFVEACVETVAKAEPLPLDLYFMLDTSGSMSGNNISALHQGVVSFCNDPTAAGIWVTGQRFAIGGYSETCDSADYANPAVPWDQLPYGAFTNWVNGLNATGYTPSVPALQGAVDACKARLQSAPNHKCVVVFVTDGNPEGNCPPTNAAAQTPLGNIAADSCANGIPVFAIGFPNLPTLGQSIINHVAAEGCTGQAFIIQSGSMGSQFTDQLKAIQQASLGCEFLVPEAEAGLVDPDQVRLTYTPGGGGPEQEFPRVDDASQCNNGMGWYYDNNNSPSKLILCPDACDIVKNDPNGEVNVAFGCEGS